MNYLISRSRVTSVVTLHRQLDYCTPIAYKAVPSRFFATWARKIVDVTESSDRSYGTRRALSARPMGRRTDIMLPTTRCQLWMNQGNGTFEAALAGLAYSEDGVPRAGRESPPKTPMMTVA
jgi:hypothetical protein